MKKNPQYDQQAEPKQCKQVRSVVAMIQRIHLKKLYLKEVKIESYMKQTSK